MGQSVLLDSIGSLLVFGMLMLAINRLNAGSAESTNAYYANYMLQTNMLTLTLMLETDLRDIGKNYTRTNTNPTPIITATSTEFSFWDGANSIDWIVGDPSELSSTPNPNDRYVYRNVNGATFRMNLGVTNMKFKYWIIDSPTDSMPTPIDPTNFSRIGPVDVTIQIESQYKTTQQYMNDTSTYEMYWRQIRSVARYTLVQSQ
jgi:hypothetical protein